MQLVSDLFLVLFVMLQELFKIPFNMFKWFKCKGWKDAKKDIKN